jgi:hypothetical protein
VELYQHSQSFGGIITAHHYISALLVPTPVWWFTGWCEKTQGCIETIDVHSCDKLEWQQLDFEKGHGIAVEWCLSHVCRLSRAFLF